MKNTRYYPPDLFLNEYHKIKHLPAIEIIGYSVKHRPIYATTIGHGQKKVLAWSQMHGNETTSTKALIDFLEQATVDDSLVNGICFRIIFQLNPDGAARYTRLNSNGVDLNRDAVNQSQPETKALMREYYNFQPSYCLNLHGQRTIFSAGDTVLPASMSFLAPAADSNRSLTAPRIKAMQLIAAIAENLNPKQDWGIGRYDDSFNINCVGDYFTAKNTPTILFEAGHYPKDYNRNNTRQLFLISLISCLKSIGNQSYTSFTANHYHEIPNNFKNLCDLEFTNVTTVNNSKITKLSIFVQYIEKLDNGSVRFIPEIIENADQLSGLKKIDFSIPSLEKSCSFSELSKIILKRSKSLIDY